MERYCVKVYCLDGEGEGLICEKHNVKKEDVKKFYDNWLNRGVQYWIEVEEE